MTFLMENCPLLARIWDSESGQLKGTLEGHTDGVQSVAISFDGKTIVSGSNDKTVRCVSSRDLPGSCPM